MLQTCYITGVQKETQWSSFTLVNKAVFAGSTFQISKVAVLENGNQLFGPDPKPMEVNKLLMMELQIIKGEALLGH